MNSTTAATVIAAGLALATLAAGGLALWLYARSKTVGSLPEQRPTTPPCSTATRPRPDEPVAPTPTAEPEPAANEPAPSERPSTRSSASTQATAPPSRERAGPSSGFFGSGSYLATHEPDLAPLHSGDQTELDLSLGSTRGAAALRPRSADTVQPVNRKRRYTIHEGQSIELKMGDAPPGAVLRPSRDNVEFEEIERAGDRIRFALHGPAGDVNVILVQEGGKRDKVIRNWKFDLREAAA